MRYAIENVACELVSPTNWTGLRCDCQGVPVCGSCSSGSSSSASESLSSLSSSYESISSSLSESSRSASSVSESSRSLSRSSVSASSVSAPSASSNVLFIECSSLYSSTSEGSVSASSVSIGSAGPSSASSNVIFIECSSSGAPNVRFYDCTTHTMPIVLTSQQAGDYQVVLVDGVCYQRVGFTADPAQPLTVAAGFQTCSQCSSTSQAPSSAVSSSQPSVSLPSSSRPSARAVRFVPCDPEGDIIVLSEDAVGNYQVVLVNGVCYDRTGYTTDPIQQLPVTAGFSTCDACGSASLTSSPTSSVESCCSWNGPLPSSAWTLLGFSTASEACIACAETPGLIYAYDWNGQTKWWCGDIPAFYLNNWVDPAGCRWFTQTLTAGVTEWAVISLPFPGDICRNELVTAPTLAVASTSSCPSLSQSSTSKVCLLCPNSTSPEPSDWNLAFTGHYATPREACNACSGQPVYKYSWPGGPDFYACTTPILTLTYTTDFDCYWFVTPFPGFGSCVEADIKTADLYHCRYQTVCTPSATSSLVDCSLSDVSESSIAGSSVSSIPSEVSSSMSQPSTCCMEPMPDVAWDIVGLTDAAAACAACQEVYGTSTIYGFIWKGELRWTCNAAPGFTLVTTPQMYTGSSCEWRVDMPLSKVLTCGETAQASVYKILDIGYHYCHEEIVAAPCPSLVSTSSCSQISISRSSRSSSTVSSEFSSVESLSSTVSSSARECCYNWPPEDPDTTAWHVVDGPSVYTTRAEACEACNLYHVIESFVHNGTTWYVCQGGAVLFTYYWMDPETSCVFTKLGDPQEVGEGVLIGIKGEGPNYCFVFPPQKTAPTLVRTVDSCGSLPSLSSASSSRVSSSNVTSSSNEISSSPTLSSSSEYSSPFRSSHRPSWPSGVSADGACTPEGCPGCYSIPKFWVVDDSTNPLCDNGDKRLLIDTYLASSMAAECPGFCSYYYDDDLTYCTNQGYPQYFRLVAFVYICCGC